jgi:predicted DNA-binding transcriptional regulator AlpA
MSFSDPLLTKADVAELLRCCERTIERQVRDRAFPPPQKFGKQSLWFQSVVHDWLARRREEQQRWAQDLHMAEPARGQNVVSLADGQADGRNQGRRAKPRSVTGLRASVFSDAELRAATRTLTKP